MYKDESKQKAAVKERQSQVRAKFYSFKESLPCKDCGNYFRHYITQFDHKGSDKKFAVSSRSASFGSEYFERELAKCDLVCANCHATRTWKRKNGALV